MGNIYAVVLFPGKYGGILVVYIKTVVILKLRILKSANVSIIVSFLL